MNPSQLKLGNRLLPGQQVVTYVLRTYQLGTRR